MYRGVRGRTTLLSVPPGREGGASECVGREKGRRGLVFGAERSGVSCALLLRLRLINGRRFSAQNDHSWRARIRASDEDMMKWRLQQAIRQSATRRWLGEAKQAQSAEARSHSATLVRLDRPKERLVERAKRLRRAVALKAARKRRVEREEASEASEAARQRGASEN